MPPIASGIIGLIGAILSLPFFAFFLMAGFTSFEGLLVVAFGATFGLPAIFQILYFIKVRKAYSRDALVANYVRGNLRSSMALKAMGGICSFACIGWTGLTLWFGVTQAPFVFVGIPFMMASAHFNLHSLLVASRKPLPEPDVEV